MPVSLPTAWLERLHRSEAPAILLSLDYEVLAANRAYRERFGDVASGRRCHDVSHGYASPCDQHGEACPLAAALATRRAARALHVHRTPRGPEHVDVQLQPIDDEHGVLVAFLEVMREVVTGSTQAQGAELIGLSRPFNDTLGLLERAAPSDVPVLLLGESGTGKELAARALHRASGRRDAAFVAVACSGLTDTLFESELCGHERGAFTGAHQRRIGLVEAARGGTLFLDEIGDVPMNMQVKLLRLLEARRFRRVGGNEDLAADFRLVCATHRSLEEMVAEGSFRHDLLYRLNTFPVRMPALRDRLDDLELLTEHLLGGRCRLHPQSLRILRGYSFPGNIRELKNILERAELLCDGAWIHPEHLPDALRGHAMSAALQPFAGDIIPLDEAERRYLAWAAQHHRGDRESLARVLGMSPRTLYRKLAALDG